MLIHPVLTESLLGLGFLFGCEPRPVTRRQTPRLRGAKRRVLLQRFFRKQWRKRALSANSRPAGPSRVSGRDSPCYLCLCGMSVLLRRLPAGHVPVTCVPKGPTLTAGNAVPHRPDNDSRAVGVPCRFSASLPCGVVRDTPRRHGAWSSQRLLRRCEEAARGTGHTETRTSFVRPQQLPFRPRRGPLPRSHSSRIFSLFLQRASLC